MESNIPINSVRGFRDSVRRESMDHLVEQVSIRAQSGMGLLRGLLDQNGPNSIGTKLSEAFCPPV